MTVPLKGISIYERQRVHSVGLQEIGCAERLTNNQIYVVYKQLYERGAHVRTSTPCLYFFIFSQKKYHPVVRKNIIVGCGCAAACCCSWDYYFYLLISYLACRWVIRRIASYHSSRNRRRCSTLVMENLSVVETWQLLPWERNEKKHPMVHHRKRNLVRRKHAQFNGVWLRETIRNTYVNRILTTGIVVWKKQEQRGRSIMQLIQLHKNLSRVSLGLVPLDSFLVFYFLWWSPCDLFV